MAWRLKRNPDGDCLYEFQDPDWITVHGCDVWSRGSCECEEPPNKEPLLQLPNFTNIVRRPCVESTFEVDKLGNDAYGFLYSFRNDDLHCIRTQASNSWIHYYYDTKKTTAPPTIQGKFDGYMDCTDSNGKILAIGLLVEFKQLGELNKFMNQLSKTIANHVDGELANS